ncbi:hypothetical protein C8J56DRAFT_1063920 [Mycena floridula]|nr:hypothetical protein C8J56DRAFT_1063920 [Mycena floridula]
MIDESIVSLAKDPVQRVGHTSDDDNFEPASRSVLILSKNQEHSSIIRLRGRFIALLTVVSSFQVASWIRRITLVKDATESSVRNPEEWNRSEKRLKTVVDTGHLELSISGMNGGGWL